MKETLQEIENAAFVNRKHVLCDRCEQGLLAEKPIQTAFWRRDDLVVIRNIPAMVCQTCGEEYVASRTAIGLDRMRGNGFAATGSNERMIVPVLDYVDPGSAE